MKFFIETYGCQMNIADSELIHSILINANMVAAENISAADIIIFNTCSVRQHAEDRVIGRISNEVNRKKNTPNLKICVVGCMAQRLGNILLERKLGIDLVVGVDQYQKIPDLISNNLFHSYTEIINDQLYDDINPAYSNNSLCDFVTIMRGCNNYCSYCIVPYVRGSERSRSLDSIINDIEIAVSRGVKDITLLGQNVNSYRWKGINFAKLLKILCEIYSVERYRFITSHPKDLSDELIEVMAQESKICEHIHLPMQSGDNEILKRMNRKYSIEQYVNLVQKLKSSIPDIAITTDIITGFPGETEKQFENTLSVMNSIIFDYAFCFKYSNRVGTDAENYEKQIPELTKLNRLQKLINLQRKHTLEKFMSKIGLKVEVLVEGFSKKSIEQVSGKTRDNKLCVFDGSAKDISQPVEVIITGATAGTLIGKRIP